MRVLVVEDDDKVASFIQKGLEELGHNTDVAITGKDGLFLATTETYDVMVIDRMLPGITDGLNIVQAIRAMDNKTPVLILSALGKVDDRVRGLRSGGDDYLVKPFAFEELLARIELLVERCSRINMRETKLTVQDLTIDLLSRKVTRGDKEIELQSREFRLLEFMVRNKGQMVTRTMLLEQVWDYHFDPQTNVIDVHISRLRQKIDKDFDNPIIKTIRGSGYIVDVPA
ncbi:MAG: winged helix-turn-helix domain-containing protein [Alphaproteobacteria bacterium]